MTTSRLFILLAVLLGGLSSIFLLPKQHAYDQPTGIDLELPKMVGGIWYGRDLEVSEKEHLSLGAETEFARKSYTNARGDEIHASIVLAGRDMNTSIHRPEWCLPAQGWTIADSKKVAIALPDRGKLYATRLSNMRFVQNGDIGDQRATIRNLNYYWFVGYNDITHSHVSRNVIDIADRLVKGYNQRWAFITVAATLTAGLKSGGLNESQTDEMLQNFIKKLVPATHKESVKFH